jgi:hypothetical protein
MFTDAKKEITKRIERYHKTGNSAITGLFEALLIIEEDRQLKKINKKKPCKKLMKKSLIG